MDREEGNVTELTHLVARRLPPRVGPELPLPLPDSETARLSFSATCTGFGANRDGAVKMNGRKKGWERALEKR